jgi:hypothetical protein
MVATNDDLLNELKIITKLLRGFYSRPEEAEEQIQNGFIIKK